MAEENIVNERRRPLHGNRVLDAAIPQIKEKTSRLRATNAQLDPDRLRMHVAGLYLSDNGFAEYIATAYPDYYKSITEN